MDVGQENRVHPSTLESNSDVDMDPVQENGIHTSTFDNDSDVDVVGLSPQEDTEICSNAKAPQNYRRKVTVCGFLKCDLKVTSCYVYM